MNNLWHPNLVSLKTFDEVFGDLLKYPPKDESFPPVKTSVLDDTLIVQFALAGYSQEQLKISVSGNTIEVSADKAQETDNLFAARAFKWTRKDFRNEWALDLANSTFNNGMLTLKIPRKEELKPKFLTINS